MHLYVSNLSIETDEKKLETLLGQYGKILEVQLLKDPITDNPLGEAIITMAEPDQAELVIAHVNHSKIDDRVVLVDLDVTTGDRREQLRVETSAK